MTGDAARARPAATTTDDRGAECAHCRGSADGCRARLAARYGRCCQLCTHGPHDADGERPAR